MHKKGKVTKKKEKNNPRVFEEMEGVPNKTGQVVVVMKNMKIKRVPKLSG